MGDTDDALRLTMARALSQGQGWYDQRITRLQPPYGVYMHWSRLVDAGEAGLLRVLGFLLPHGTAEAAMRMTWPLLWLLPGIVAALLIGRRLGGGRAVFLAAISVALSIGTSGQFQPGRIDHHNVQIACCMMAFAAAVQRPTAWWAVASASATALGLAVGLEALPFLAIIGAAVAISWAFGRVPRSHAMAYGATLSMGVMALHLLQTPPWRWSVTACDALAFNLVSGLATAGLGLMLATLVADGRGTGVRLALLAGIGALAATTYLALDPVCLDGPTAAIDPTLKSLWLSQVNEMQPWPVLFARSPATAAILAAPVATGVLGWLWLGRRREMRTDPALVLCGALLIVSGVLGLNAIRSMSYAVWFFAPLLGAAVADFGAVVLNARMLPCAVLIVALNLAPGWALAAVAAWRNGDVRSAQIGIAAPDDHCLDTAAYTPLARMKPGLVLSEIDLGPYVLANTGHSALQAPYHRMTWGIRQAHLALTAPAAEAEPRIRSLGVAYILNCPAHANHSDRIGLPSGSLQGALDQGGVPAWLERISARSEPLQVYRVRPVQ